MKLIKPSFEIIEQGPGIQGFLKHIELCGRVCYKSEDFITEHSAKKFVENLIKSGHTSVLEHGTVYLKVPFGVLTTKYSSNPYAIVRSVGNTDYITTNYRVMVEHNYSDDLKYMVRVPDKWHIRRYSVRFICDRGVSHEFVRHRVFSFSQESTRYCNYSKDKFNKELTYILPCWIPSELEGTYPHLCKLNWSHEEMLRMCKLLGNEIAWNQFQDFITAIDFSEDYYLNLIGLGWTPQQARSVLPHSLKTELIMTGAKSQWEAFFKLRNDNAAHPQAKELATPLHEEFIKRRYIE